MSVTGISTWGLLGGGSGGSGQTVVIGELAVTLAQAQELETVISDPAPIDSTVADQGVGATVSEQQTIVAVIDDGDIDAEVS